MIETTQKLDPVSDPIQASHPGALQNGKLQDDDVHAQLKPLATEGEHIDDGEVSPNDAKDNNEKVDASVDVENENDLSKKEIADSGEVQPGSAEIEDNRDLSGKESKIENDEPATDMHSNKKQNEKALNALHEENEPTGESGKTEMKQSVEDNLPTLSEDSPYSEPIDKGTKEEPKDEKLTANPVAVDEVSEMAESSRLVEGAHKKESDDIEGTEEPSSPRPVDEEQPFVSEYFEDETQTIIGEGSLVGDNDISDVTTNADSIPSSPRSMTDEIANVLHPAEASSEAVHDDRVIVEEPKAESEAEPSDLIKVNSDSVSMSDNGSDPHHHENSNQIQTIIEQDHVNQYHNLNLPSPQDITCVKEQERQEIVVSAYNVVNVATTAVEPVELHPPSDKCEIADSKSEAAECSNQLESLTCLKETNVKQNEIAVVSEVPIGVEAEVHPNDDQGAAEQPKVEEYPSSEKAVVVKKKDKRIFGWCTII